MNETLLRLREFQAMKQAQALDYAGTYAAIEAMAESMRLGAAADEIERLAAELASRERGAKILAQANRAIQFELQEEGRLLSVETEKLIKELAQANRAILEANACMMASEGCPLIYFMDKKTPEYLYVKTLVKVQRIKK